MEIILHRPTGPCVTTGVLLSKGERQEHRIGEAEAGRTGLLTGPPTKAHRQPQEAEEGKDQILPWGLWKGHSSANPLVLVL